MESRVFIFVTNNCSYQRRKYHLYTDPAALELSRLTIISTVDSKNNYIDLSKAFDSLKHARSHFKKFSYYGITNRDSFLLENYLSNRSPFVQIDNVRFTIKQDLTGIPQCSITAPLLFKIFMNDIAKLLQQSALALYVEDAMHHTILKTIWLK